MNYRKIYIQLIERAQARIPEGYTERHHILPQCLGGDNSKENIVRLTPEEHYLAHQLLVKMHPDNPKLVYAALLMTKSGNGTRTNNKLFGWIKKKLSEARKGKKHTEEHIKNNSEAQKGKKLSEETRAKMSATRTGMHRTEEQKRKSSETQKGRPKTPEQREKTRLASLEAWRKRKEANPNAGCGAENPAYGKTPWNKKNCS